MLLELRTVKEVAGTVPKYRLADQPTLSRIKLEAAIARIPGIVSKKKHGR